MLPLLLLLFLLPFGDGQSVDPILTEEAISNLPSVKDKAAIRNYAQAKLQLVSIPNLAISTDERIVGFEIHVKSGRIAQLPNVPIGWSLTVDNDASWSTTLAGNVIVGAASLDPNFFQGFLVIEKEQTLGLPFKIDADIMVTKDFSNYRHITLGMKRISLKAITEKRR
jgi:hypothetical protein